MTNKEFHELIIKIINVIKNDKSTGDAIDDIECSLKKYQLDFDTIKEYKESINYQKVFLTIYYDIARICEIYKETNLDGKSEKTIELAHSYITTIMYKAGILDEYKITYMTGERYLKLKEKYSLQ